MPNIKSAKKRVELSKVAYEKNKAEKSALKTTLKKFEAAVDGGDRAVAEGAYKLAVKAVDQAAAKGLLRDVTLFDIYNGANLPAGKKSVAFNLVLRADDRSLTAQEADDEVKLILAALEKDFGAVLR